MAYELQVTQVGPDEYPLINVLRDSIGSSEPTPAQALAARPDLLTLLAHLEGNPVGYCVAFGEGDGAHRLHDCGILPDYRRQGLGSQMLRWHQDFARSRGYRRLVITAPATCLALIGLARREGFAPDATALAGTLSFTKPLLP